MTQTSVSKLYLTRRSVSEWVVIYFPVNFEIRRMLIGSEMVASVLLPGFKSMAIDATFDVKVAATFGKDNIIKYIIVELERFCEAGLKHQSSP